MVLLRLLRPGSRAEVNGAVQPFICRWMASLAVSWCGMLGQDPGMNLTAEGLRSIGLLWSGGSLTDFMGGPDSGGRPSGVTTAAGQRGSCVLTLTVASAGERWEGRRRWRML